MIEIHQIINQPISSNCFVIFDKTVGCDCIIVDPGSRDCKEIIDYLRQSKLSPKYIILTHEHFDHCWGINELVSLYGIPVICSELCSENIKYCKKNCSVFYDYNQQFEVNSGDTISIESLGSRLEFANTSIIFYHTPGHTEASISFVIDKYLFTGDTLLFHSKTITKLPTGSDTKLKQSLKFYQNLPIETVVMGGHGESFSLKDYDINSAL